MSNKGLSFSYLHPLYPSTERVGSGSCVCPSVNIFIAGRPKAALLFWFFGGFRCGVPLFIVILGIY